jgi:hypothetical protein
MFGLSFMGEELSLKPPVILKTFMWTDMLIQIELKCSDTQNYWVSGLCPSFRILNTINNILETVPVSVLRWRGGRRHLLYWVP